MLLFVGMFGVHNVYVSAVESVTDDLCDCADQGAALA